MGHIGHTAYQGELHALQPSTKNTYFSCKSTTHFALTIGALLPETLEDIGNLRNNDKGFFQCWSKATLKARMEKLAADASTQHNSEKGQSENEEKGKF